MVILACGQSSAVVVVVVVRGLTWVDSSDFHQQRRQRLGLGMLVLDAVCQSSAAY